MRLSNQNNIICMLCVLLINGCGSLQKIDDPKIYARLQQNLKSIEKEYGDAVIPDFVYDIPQPKKTIKPKNTKKKRKQPGWRPEVKK